MAQLVLSVVGSDRPGLTRALAAAVLSAGGNWLLQPLDSKGGAAGSPVRAGLVAALSDRPDRVTWIVTGVDEAAVPQRLATTDLDGVFSDFARRERRYGGVPAVTETTSA